MPNHTAKIPAVRPAGTPTVRTPFIAVWAVSVVCVVCVAAIATTPMAMASDMLVSNWNTHSVLAFDGADGGFIEALIPSGAGGLSRAHSVRQGPDGNLYVTSNGTDEVLRYAADGTPLGAFVTAGSGGLDGPADAAFGPDQNLYVSSIGQSMVLRYDGTTGAFIDTFVTVGSGGLSGGENIQFGPDQNLYVCSANNNTVKQYDGASGTFLSTYVAAGNGLTQPHDMAFLPNGHLLVASFAGGNPIIEYDEFGVFDRILVPPGMGLTSPHGLAIGPDGEVYATSFNTNRVLRFRTSDGQPLGVFASGNGLGGPTFVTFVPGSTGIATDLAAPTTTSRIALIFPNPARAAVHFEVGPGPRPESLVIFDALGRQVWSTDVAASGAVAWDGWRSDGERAASGTYFAALRGAAGTTATRAFVRLK